jgi:hypothetical protein
MCGVVTELQKTLRRIGVSWSIVVIANWGWIFCIFFVDILIKRIQKRCLSADAYLYQMCHVLCEAPRNDWYISSFLKRFYRWKRDLGRYQRLNIAYCIVLFPSTTPPPLTPTNTTHFTTKHIFSLLLGIDMYTLLLLNINTEQHDRPQVLLNVASIVGLAVRIQNIVFWQQWVPYYLASLPYVSAVYLLS